MGVVLGVLQVPCCRARRGCPNGQVDLCEIQGDVCEIPFTVGQRWEETEMDVRLVSRGSMTVPG